MSKPHIVLVIPPGLPGTTPNREGASGLGTVEPGSGAFRYPPHTVATVAAALGAAGYEVRAIDAVVLDYDVGHCVGKTLATQAALIGVFVSWATREADRLFLASLRAAHSGSAPIVAFGVSVHHMHEALDNGDHLLEGEPELAFPALCTRLLQDSASVPQVVSPAEMDAPGYYARGLLIDLDALPIPAWDCFPIERYPYLSILSSRGCEESCSWCPYVVAQGRRFRACSPDRVLAELREVVRLYQPKRVVFRDPAFAFDRDRVAQMCHLIINDPFLRSGRTLKWECESHPQHLNRRLLGLMSAAGCVGIKVGLETTGGSVLHGQGRIAQEDETSDYLAGVTSLARTCAWLGIACRLYVLAGLPGQTLAMARDTAEFVRTLRPDSLSVKAVKRYPGLRPVDAAQSPSKEEVRAQVRVLQQAGEEIAQQRALHSARWQRPRRWMRGLVRQSLRAASLFSLRGH